MSATSRVDAIAGAGWLERRASGAMLGLGAAAIAATLSLDLLGLSDPSRLSARQVLLGAFGLMLVLNALAWRAPDGWRRVSAWLEEPAAVRVGAAARYGALLVQLALLLLVVRQFELENEAFFRSIAVVAAGGFALNVLVPPERRLVFFVALSLGGIASVLKIPDAAWLVALGLGLIGLCHMPAPFPVRVGLLLLAGALLTALRTEWIAAPWSRAVWPTLGTMFMFRLIVYLYDLRHRAKPRPAESLSYFFLLPNVVFPLFPVVDFSTFRRTYYGRDQWDIYQTGVRWMLRGVAQLLLYRVVYQYFTLSPSDVVSPTDLGRFLLANYLLYVRVSGQFHLITGMLHLFGFDLPLTNRRYYLAAGFTDYWRRINIYWKDFMQKVVFYPTYFRLRAKSETAALVVGTLLVFLVTWSLHAYQWFWLLGSFPLLGPDMLFWTTLGVLMVANTLIEARRGRAGQPDEQQFSLSAALGLTLKTAGTFLVMSVLWSLWVSPTIGDWLALLNVDWSRTDWSALAVPLGVLVAIGGGVATEWLMARAAARAEERGESAAQPSFFRQAALAAAALAGLYVAGRPELAERLGPRAAEAAAAVRLPQLNRQDATQLQRGYYENLMGVSQFNSQLWEVYMNRPMEMPPIWQTAAGRRVDNYLGVELVPSQRAVLRGAVLTTNRWAMRDRDYEQVKPAGSLRLALIGASTTMGWAVGDDETFESLVEQRLNREPGRFGPYRLLESLNFAVPGYVPVQYVALTERALQFQPDVLVLTTQDNDLERLLGRLALYAIQGTDFPDDSVRSLAAGALARGGAVEAAVVRELKPHGPAILERYYRAIAQASRARGAKPVWLYLPGLERQSREADRRVLTDAARAAGFEILDLTGVYDGEDQAKLTVGPADFHPNARGHRIVAARLYQALTERPELLAPLGAPPTR